jgi:spore germination protein
MIPVNNKISIRQLQVLLILEIFGMGVIILPRRVATFANQDGWIVIILGTLLVLVYTFLITYVGKIFPNDSFKTYCSKVLSKPVGIFLTLVFVIKILITTALELRFFGEVIGEVLLPKTPLFIISLTMLSLCGYAASKGFEARAKIAEILIVAMLVPLIIVFLSSIMGTDFTNLMPVMDTPLPNLLHGAFFIGVSFTGLEFLLLVNPYSNNPKNVQKGAFVAIIITGFLMLLITILSIAKFGYYDLKLQSWPVIEMMDMVQMPGSFMERQGALIISFWIISIFAMVNAGLFFSCLLLKDVFCGVFKKVTHSNYIIACIVIIFAISFLPRNINHIIKLMDLVFIMFTIFYFFFIPLLLIIIAKIRRLG